MEHSKCNDFSTVHSSTECREECEAAVLRADTLPKADNFPLPSGDIKVAKVLAEFVVQIDNESVIRLNEPAYEIKRVEKQVFLKECRYIPPTGKLFIEGFIRKNIEYASRKCTSKHGAIAGSIKDTTVHVPFKVFTKVEFKEEPKITPDLPAQVTRYFNEKRMGKDIREADRSNIEILNEPVFCEIEWTAVFDADIDHKGTPIDCLPDEEEFQEFTDKAVVFIAIKLLQKQQVCLHKDEHCKDDEKKTPGLFNSEWNVPIMEILEGK